MKMILYQLVFRGAINATFTNHTEEQLALFGYNAKLHRQSRLWVD